MILRRVLSSCSLVLVLAFLGWAGLALGQSPVSAREILLSLQGPDVEGASFIVSEFRLPRVLGAVVVGLGLGAAGAITQSLVRNPLASPDIVGVSAGASSAAVLTLAGGTGLLGIQSFFSGIPLVFSALCGGLLAGVLVIALSWHRGILPQRLVLIGLGVNAGFSALTSWVLLRSDSSGLASSLAWLSGSLNEVNSSLVLSVSACVGILLLLLLLSSRLLGLLRFDTRVSSSLGVRVPLAQIWLLFLGVALASVVTAVGGAVAFVAFVAPQIAFALFRTEGPEPFSAALVGAGMTLASDLVAQHAFSQPLPVGVVTSLVGVPALLWILLRRGRRT